VKNSKDITEKRTAVRFPLSLPVAVKQDSSQKQTETLNISAGGVLLHLETELQVGADIEFTISMPASILGAPKDVLVNCVGRVVRCSVEDEGRVVAAVIDDYQFERL
jgi:hypothetical protein